MSDNPMLNDLVFDESCGALHYKGARYLLIRPETIAGFQKALCESFGREAEEMLYTGGFEGGSLSTKKYQELHKFSDTEMIEFMMNMGGQIGWGRFSLESYDSNLKVLRISVAHSPFAESYGRSSHGVCHLIRGVLSGMATILFDQKCALSEAECLSKGDARCLFATEGKR